ncbi:hypothetical protein [Cellulomonas sp. SG140]|uniref:hypothetical protein n=1 Tax=Cellulomonas sp. SG140 TaxID=2976536 RepID=UPI0021E71F3B|nr:hypothetical protein [Cellulomonas sp. SG140]
MATPNLPASVLSRLELSPIEDFMLALLREDFPDIPIYSLIPKTPTFPFIVVRRGHRMGGWNGDPRFTDAALVELQVFAQDPDGDEAAALISEAVRVALRDAWLSHRVIPGRGSVIEITMTEEPSRVTDWATSSGPVQFADLPSGVWRYETHYLVSIRKER